MKKRQPSLLLTLALLLTLFPLSAHADDIDRSTPKDAFVAERLADRAVLMEDYSWYVLKDNGELRSYAVGEDGTVADRLLLTEVRDFRVGWYGVSNFPWQRRECLLYVLREDGVLSVYDISSTQPQWELVHYRVLLENVSSMDLRDTSDIRATVDHKALICETTNGQVWKVTRHMHYETVSFPVEETTWEEVRADTSNYLENKKIYKLSEDVLWKYTFEFNNQWEEEPFRDYFTGKDIAYIWQESPVGAFFFLSKTGTLWGVGDNKYGQLGVRKASSFWGWNWFADTVTLDYPHRILDNVEEIFFDRARGCVVYARDRDGLLWQWGFETDEFWTWEEDGGLGEHGVGINEAIPESQVLPHIAPDDMQDAAYLFDGRGLMVKKDGSLWCKVGRTGAEQVTNLIDEKNWYKWGAKELDRYVCVAGPGTLLGDPQTEAPDVPTAYASTQSVLVDGLPVEFQAYALKDQSGNDTNYVKLRDVASVLNGSAAEFNVGWDGAVNIETGKGYTPNGSEMKTPFSGSRAYETAAAETRINGSPVDLEAIVLKDDVGGAYTYYKLRDLGAALSFKVNWTAEKGIFIETK